jgi:hypothetical protein
VPPVPENPRDEARLALLGGCGVVVGAFLPVISNITPAIYYENTTKARHVAIGLGVVMLACWAWQKGRASKPARTLQLISGSATALLFTVFAIAGQTGLTQQTDFGPVQFTFDPGIGLVVIVVGSLLVAYAAVKSRSPRAEAGTAAPSADER